MSSIKPSLVVAILVPTLVLGFSFISLSLIIVDAKYSSNSFTLLIFNLKAVLLILVILNV